MNKYGLTVFMISFLSSQISLAQFFSYPIENPLELGKVKWLRSYDEALKESKLSNLPVLILFQEVPGCSNCTRFGQNVLSDPLIVETIETCFIPLCIYNNLVGSDQEILKKYAEPAWNNPVIRVVDQYEKDIIERQPDFRSKAKTIKSLIEGIKKSGQHIPEYLHLYYEETIVLENKSYEEVFLSMVCFWSGEKEIGGINGVIRTEAGYMHGKEVVKIIYDKEKTTLDDVVQKANKVGCADEVFGAIQKNVKTLIQPIGIYRKDREDKYYLSQSPYKVVPMTGLQKTKVNRAIAKGENPAIFLSPKQLSILTQNKSGLSLISSNLDDVWFKN